jgi:hypothetical protein
LKRGSAASISVIPVRRVERCGRDVRRGYVNEVSVFGADLAPAEPLAQVGLLYEPKPKPAPLPAAAQRASGRTRERAEMDELRRRLEFAGDNANFELILSNLNSNSAM